MPENILGQIREILLYDEMETLVMEDGTGKIVLTFSTPRYDKTSSSLNVGGMCVPVDVTYEVAGTIMRLVRDALLPEHAGRDLAPVGATQKVAGTITVKTEGVYLIHWWDSNGNHHHQVQEFRPGGSISVGGDTKNITVTYLGSA